MDRERQTLELLTLLGDEVADAVLGRLQPERAEKLRTAMTSETAQLSTISRQREVLDEFECFFQFALKSRSSDESSEETGESDESAEQDSELNNNESIEDKSNADEEHDATDSMEQSEESDSSEDESSDADSDSTADDESDAEEESMATASKAVPTGDPFKDLQLLSLHQVSAALASEQPRTTAILLSNLPSHFTGEVLNLLSAEYQKLVMRELTSEQHAPPVLVERIAKATFARASQLPAGPPDSRDHADKVAEMLRNVPKAGRRNMLASIEEQDPELAKALLTRIYRFDDIKTLGKALVQRVLGEVDSTNLTTALFGAPDDVKEAIFVNLSKRARQTIEEEMQFMTNLPESRIKQAREAIAEVIAKIDMEGEPT